jgi:hypothetical protein
MIIMVGQATTQLNIQPFIHAPINPALIPDTLTVVMPDTTQDMIPDRIRANMMGERRAGIIADLSHDVRPFDTLRAAKARGRGQASAASIWSEGMMGKNAPPDCSPNHSAPATGWCSQISTSR